MTVDIEVSGEKKQFKLHDLEEFRNTILIDVTTMKEDIQELKQDTKELLSWFNEARVGLQFLFRLGSWAGTFVIWSAKVVAASAVVWAAISAAKGIKLPDLGK